eukprot:TRINITY_DN8120_c0_g1_i1.p1 TRINITY_DN8120_c0_g1~~TRINITY_DN8120_c0_g1_i1.p1  ORF type:complete len:218 (-),score=37.89 TRINITY_DN8120_c0_g1_i1:8-661(-)
MYILTVVLIVLGCCGINTAADPPKPVWPLAFDVSFGLTVTASPPTFPKPLVNVTSHFYYDFNIQASVIDYPVRCIPIFAGAESAPCKVYFVPTNIVFTSPTQTPCIWFPGVGTVPPAFLAAFNFSTTTLGIDMLGVPHYSNFWVADGGFQYWTEVTTGRDVALIDGGSILWNFHYPLQVRPQNPATFAVPSNLLACPFATKVVDPLVKLSILHSKLQ